MDVAGRARYAVERSGGESDVASPSALGWLIVEGAGLALLLFYFFFSSRRRHTRLQGDWSSDVCSSDLSGRRRRATRRMGGDAVRSTGVAFAVRASLDGGF